MRRILRENGLSLTMIGLFLLALVGQLLTGFREHRDEQASHGSSSPGISEYLISGHFLESVFENWESEFLQMALYVTLTAVLYQKGSPESRPLSGQEEGESKPGSKSKAPWPVRHGGLVLKLYERSLGLALFLLFLVSFAFHAVSGARLFNQDQALHGGKTLSIWQFLGTSQFWFESFQNWQSEFLSVGVLVILSIFLRQKGSPESKPVETPHLETGNE
jgi:hypothetical protein